MPVYNQQRYVAAAIESVLRQTYSNFEFIIVDDGSTDKTVDIINRYRDPRIELVRAQHRGFIAALLEGFKRAEGDWIARMDSDDICDAQRLAKQVQFADDHPECVFVGTAYGFTTPNSRFVKPRVRFEWRYIEPAEITFGNKCFGDPTVMFHRMSGARVGYYDLHFENENPLWYRLLTLGKGAALGEALYYTRWMMGSVSRSRLDHWDVVHHAVRNKYDPQNALKLRRSTSFSVQEATTTKLKQGVEIYLRSGDRQAAFQLAWHGWKSCAFSLPRNKLLVYAILGIEGLRRAAVRESALQMMRCAHPFHHLRTQACAGADGFIQQ